MHKTKRFLQISLALALFAAPLAAVAQEPESTVVVAEGPGAGTFKLIGHSDLGGRGMNAAIAVRRGFAYIGSRTDGGDKPSNNGVLVVDISDPKAPEVVHTIGAPYEDNEGETSRELRIWPEKELLIVMNLGSNCGQIHACSPDTVEDNFRFYDISGKHAAKPKFVAEYKPSVDPHEMYLWDDPHRPGRALLFLSTPGGDNVQLMVTDISKARRGKFTELSKQAFPVGESGNDNRLHSLTVTPNGKRAYFAHLEAGFFVANTSDYARNLAKPEARLITTPANAPSWPEAIGPGAHSAVPIWGKHFALVTDEVYGESLRPLDSGGCPWGWTKILDVADPKKPTVEVDYKMPMNVDDFCSTDEPRPNTSFSAHNPTLTQHLAFISWHSAGLQGINISKPLHPTKAAEFLPEPLTVVEQEDPVLSSGQDKVVVWSFPIIKKGLIYVVDIRNGLYILKYRGPFQSEVAKTGYLEGNSNRGAAMRLGRL
jgi:hypothetical protein